MLNILFKFVLILLSYGRKKKGAFLFEHYVVMHYIGWAKKTGLYLSSDSLAKVNAVIVERCVS